MNTTPIWLAATAGQQSNAGQINQFLGTHNSTFLYQGGVLKSSQTTGSAVFTTTQSTYLSQRFTTASAQTSIGSVGIQLSTVGGSPTSAAIPQITVGIYADSGGFPSGSALGSTVVSNEYVYDSSFFVTVPMVVGGLTPSTAYHVVTNPVGSATNYYVWQRSNQTTGAYTSADGIAWAAQTYGFMYEIFDQTSSGLLSLIYEDTGARWTSLGYSPGGQLQTITQYTVAQGSSYMQSTNTLSYTNGLLTGVI